MDFNLNYFLDKNVCLSGIELFNQLGIEIINSTSLPFEASKIFQNNLMEKEPFSNIENLYFIGRIDEDCFTESMFKESLDLDSIISQSKYNGLLVFGVELKDYYPTRGKIAEITRALNRHSKALPVILVARYKNPENIEMLSISAIERTKYIQSWRHGEKVGKVSILRDINIKTPHSGHIRTLLDLKIDSSINSFDKLYEKWRTVFDVQLLNKKFYSELFNWYLWAIGSVSFPNDVKDEKDDLIYNSESVIRLLTRLIFVWFIKEKNLVPENLFNEKKLNSILKNLNPESEETSIYYRAILQNLFFATLNTPMDKDITNENKEEKRQFINPNSKTNKEQYLDQTKYRYYNYFIQPDKALELFASIPFLNGGLFECLDFKDGNKEIRFDGFSSTEKRQAFVPDKLFFADEFIIDLNSEYDTKGKKYKVKGLINILNSYKFTITENTPIEEEIALDPELLGKVFENLLASYNPETKTTARKQTGSFYTPREIVNYMVDESILAFLKQKLDNTDESETKLRDLFRLTDANSEFSDREIDILIKAISEAKILDPACGSGAFPMGVLHRLVDLLNKLDPENKHWNELQKKRAIDETAEVFESGDTEERRIRLDEINKAFDLSMNHPDYARKLFLIENCIYGVDIQQIAIQISKLRFFISLIVDQKVNDSKPNRNILSMPNLETKFVAANTLIGLDKPMGLTLLSIDVERLEKELASIRHKIFFTRKYSAKKELKNRERSKREELKKALMKSGFGEATASQMAGWNPFDPMKSAAFFDPETMFGLARNTSEVQAKKQSREISLLYKQIEAINKQIEAINVAFHLKQEYEIIKLQLVTAYLQASIIETELDRIKSIIENLFGSIEKTINNVVRDQDNIGYTVNSLNQNIKDINKRLTELEKKLIPISETESNQEVFDIVIGNPPWGAKIEDEDTLKKKLNIKKSLDSSEYFILKTKEFLHNKHSILSFIVPKSIIFANSWIISRNALLQQTLLSLGDAGISFESVNLESILFVLQNKESVLSNKIKIVKFEPLKRFASIKTLVELNKIEQEIMIKSSALIVTDVNDFANQIIKKIQSKKWFIENYEREVFRGLYLPDKIKEEIIDKGKYFFVNKVPDVSMYCIRKIITVDLSRYFDLYKSTINKLQRERIIIKVLRGSRLTCAYVSKDVLTTEKLVNLIIDSKLVHPYYVLGSLNSKLTSYYLGKALFSDITETARVMDDCYIKKAPLILLPQDQQAPFITLVDRIMETKKNDQKADTKALEEQIDLLIYKLYELNYDEVKIIDPEFNMSEEEYKNMLINS